MTRQRRLILAELRGPGGHMSADEMYARVRAKLPSISLGTVYRNLEILSEAKLIRKLCLGGGRKQYDGGLHRHYHVRCVLCGRVSDVPVDSFGDLDAAARKASDFGILGHELVFDGECPECKASQKTPAD